MARGDWFWLFSLSRLKKTELSASPLKENPPVTAAKGSIYRRRGSGEGIVVHGEQGTPGEIFKQGAWGFKFWEQHAVIVSCFKGGVGL